MYDANLDMARHAPSLWARTAINPPRTSALLSGDHRADLVIIGSGFTGLSAALRAKQSGLRIVEVEAVEIGSDASG